ncbi:unnamed protein product [Adineta ricciae]|uniref:Uncharacterized protein n=1 Tax=Adineta ricciae TaxID=249248 RepID=A0A814AFR6_ADIRI|nr:unnamed protein product [Adineta ricciae]CAF0914216.1 unnamed protein product [Adineta ricciae]
MQRFSSLAGSSSRFIRAIAMHHSKNDGSLLEHGVKLYNVNNGIFQRCLATQNKNSNKVDSHADLYKPSTAKQETHVPDDLKHHHQPPETINTTLNTTAVGGGKVWSNQSPSRVHVANKGTTFVPKTNNDVQHIQDKTVYTTQGEVNITDPFQTHKLQSDITSAKLAEAEAASAFETFEPGTPLSSASVVESNFMPKVSSAEVYSTISSPTAQFQSNGPPTPHESVKYETAVKGKVFGGQDTSADSMKHPKEDPFTTGNKNKPRQAK